MTDVVDRLTADQPEPKPDIWALMAKRIEFTRAAVARASSIAWRRSWPRPRRTTYAPGIL